MAAPLVKKFLAFKKKKSVITVIRLHIKMGTQYSLCQDTNKIVCVLCWKLLCTEEPSTHSCHEPNKTNPIFPSYFFQAMTFTISKVVPPVQAF